jgi:hypothetical protein
VQSVLSYIPNNNLSFIDSALPYEPWSKVVHCIRNRSPFGTPPTLTRFSSAAICRISVIDPATFSSTPGNHNKLSTLAAAVSFTRISLHIGTHSYTPAKAILGLQQGLWISVIFSVVNVKKKNNKSHRGVLKSGEEVAKLGLLTFTTTTILEPSSVLLTIWIPGLLRRLQDVHIATHVIMLVGMNCYCTLHDQKDVDTCSSNISFQNHGINMELVPTLLL